MIEATEKFGNQLLRLVKKCLRTGTPPRGTHWDPHSANTIKRYGEHTLLNYTGQYLRSVQIVKQKNRTYVGIPTNLKKTRKGDRTSKRTLNQVAIMLDSMVLEVVIYLQDLYGHQLSNKLVVRRF